jgi:anaerobic magnesium-protoporphyrin IX monomethyl ester cyclase
MAQVTLIRPPVLYPKFRPDGNVTAIPPLGLAYIAGTLQAAGHDVKCIDAPGEALTAFRVCAVDPTLFENGLSIPEILERIPIGSQVIGLSCMFSYDWIYVSSLLRAIRERFPGALIVLGGEHATADHEYILKFHPEVDACVLGEGENKMLGLLEAFEKGVPKDELPGAAVRDRAGRVRKNAEKDGDYRIRDVDAIPRPAWELFPVERYLDAGGGFGSLGARAIPMLASRGCPHACTFCSSPQMWTTRWKARDVGDVIDEIKTYVRRYGINRVEFYDLTAIVDGRWIAEFCQRMIDENLGVTWAMPSGTRTEALTPEVLELIRRSGCTKLTYPFETGNPRVNTLIKKKINYERSLASLKHAVKAGIIVKNNMILGFPFQTFRDILVEYAFAVRLAWIGSRDIVYYNFAPYPGSELHDRFVAEGKIVKDASYPRWLRNAMRGNFVDGQSWCPALSGRMLRLLCLFGIAQFYAFQYLFRPHRLVSSLYRMSVGKPLTTLELWITGSVTRAVRQVRSAA